MVGLKIKSIEELFERLLKSQEIMDELLEDTVITNAEKFFDATITWDEEKEYIRKTLKEIIKENKNDDKY